MKQCKNGRYCLRKKRLKLPVSQKNIFKKKGQPKLMKLLEFILNDIAQPRAQATRELVRELTCYMPESFFYFAC